jgi:hypothetical protein
MGRCQQTRSPRKARKLRTSNLSVLSRRVDRYRMLGAGETAAAQDQMEQDAGCLISCTSLLT